MKFEKAYDRCGNPLLPNIITCGYRIKTHNIFNAIGLTCILAMAAYIVMIGLAWGIFGGY